MKKRVSKLISLLLVAVMAVSLAGCGGSSSNDGGVSTDSAAAGDQTQAADTATGDAAEVAGGETVSQGAAETGANIVNVGVTDTLGSLNPLLLDAGEINRHAASLMFIPLMDLDADLNFQPMLADSITTEDNIHFVIHIDENAVWSDGTPITSDDVLYTALRLASPVIGNTSMLYYAFEGVGDDGFVEEGAESISGIRALDDKTVEYTAKYPMALPTFQNTYGRYLLTLPKHVIEQFSEDELSTADWFNHPDVISGPYFVTDFDVDHYISYEANPDYFRGAPKIEKLNIRIVEGSQLYAGLLSGEIDITQHTMSVIPIEDYASVEALDNVEVIYGSPVTNQSVFIQTQNVTDARVRQAMLYAIDRDRILNDLLNGHGEIVDGFLSSASPFFDDGITPVTYDPEKATALLSEAGWDGSQTIRFYVNSGDTTFVNAASIIAAQWAAVGIKAEIQTVDFATLMEVADSGDFDVLAVQYTYAPVDPYPDVAWLLGGEDGWTKWNDPAVDEALTKSQATSDNAEITELYSFVDTKVQEEVPMFSAYIISAQGAVNKRLANAKPSVYGFFNDVQNWEISE